MQSPDICLWQMNNDVCHGRVEFDCGDPDSTWANTVPIDPVSEAASVAPTNTATNTANGSDVNISTDTSIFIPGAEQPLELGYDDFDVRRKGRSTKVLSLA